MFEVIVPATLSNLGPGFDVLGMAVGLENRFTFRPSEDFEVAGRRISPKNHAALTTALLAAEHFGHPLDHALAVDQVEAVPRSRGLGSSATARAAGFIAWCHFSRQRPDLEDALGFLAAQEGHPDNVVPAMLGGFTAAFRERGKVRFERLEPPSGLTVGLCIPEVRVATDEARGVLPSQVSREVCVHNSARLAFLMIGLLTGRTGALGPGTDDRLHQPYRKGLIGPVDEALLAARAAGAYCAFISGSGSTLATFAPAEAALPAASAMAAVFAAHGLEARALAVEPEPLGAWTRVTQPE